MTNYAAGDAFQELKDSLEVDVLSEGFKRFVLLAALDAYNEGFRDGKASADPATGLTPQEVPPFGVPQVVPAFEPSLPASTLTTNNPDVILDVLHDSIDSDGSVMIEYVDRFDRKTSRKVEPTELVDSETAAICWDVEKGEHRRFKLDNIKSLTVGG